MSLYEFVFNSVADVVNRLSDFLPEAPRHLLKLNVVPGIKLDQEPDSLSRNVAERTPRLLLGSNHLEWKRPLFLGSSCTGALLFLRGFLRCNYFELGWCGHLLHLGLGLEDLHHL